MRRFEYATHEINSHMGFFSLFNMGKVDVGAFERLLREWGREGWELVTVFPSMGGLEGRVKKLLAVFKRELPDR